MQPLEGVRVLDFGTLLPGPLATLILAEAGAEVIKIERPGRGDEMRSYEPKFGADSVNFALLNRGKRSIAIDLKAPGAVDRLAPLIVGADVVVEQFRPGVMDRLGLGYEVLRNINPRLIYCAITGYGQHGPRKDVAAHDLNYVAEAGMLSLAAGADGAPVPPAALVADIGGGTYPAVINILLALRNRERTGEGCKLDLAMADNLFTFLYWALGNGLAAGEWPKPGSDLVTGGSPRYNVYRSKDGKFIAAAPLEQKFWENFCDAIGLPPALRDDAPDPAATKRAVAEIIRGKSAAEWRSRFERRDVCCSVMASIEEALRDAHFAARGVFARKLVAGGETITALPVPVAEIFRPRGTEAGYPALGEANSLMK
ncbi:MAG: CoA transferase [Betaproteobacteria bacterium]|nr:CoA transferase [Betaproteobacteria bacterium]